MASEPRHVEHKEPPGLRLLRDQLMREEAEASVLLDGGRDGHTGIHTWSGQCPNREEVGDGE